MEVAMVGQSLEAQLAQFESPLAMLRQAPTRNYPFPFPSEYSTWRDEQRAWKATCTMFDQGHHMTDYYFKGPDVRRLFEDVSVNSYEKFGAGKGKQFVGVNEDGYIVSDAILFGFADDEWVLVGTPVAPHWVAYHAETGGYDVEVVRDEAAAFNPRGRLTFRFQLNGPATQAIVEGAHGGALDHIKFFNIGTFDIAGAPVRALNHTMAGVPGLEMTGLELVGPIEARQAVLQALLAAGEPHGLRQGGSRAYVSTILESGWIPAPVPAIYTDEHTRGYRNWLSAMGIEGFAALSGSYAGDRLEDYYLTPWDLGYGRVIKFDHDFIGREALERMADQPHRQKVWLRWDDKDVESIIAASLHGKADRPMFIDMPITHYNHFHYDAVFDGDNRVGISTHCGYTANIGGHVSLAMLDQASAVDGKSLTLIWGEPEESRGRPNVDPHVQTPIRVTVSTRPPAE
jgi:vanillate/3-O-methylgallate O-demethylase